METIDFLFKKAWPFVRASAKDFQVFIQDRDQFYRGMSARRGVDPRACLFGLLLAVGLGLLSLPAYRNAGVEPTVELAVLLVAVNALLLAIYGACFGAAARLMRGEGVLRAVNAFFYVASVLLVVRLLEMSALSARVEAIAASCALGNFDEAITSTITSGTFSSRSNFLVLLGYLCFCCMTVQMLRQLYGFSKWRSRVAAVVGMVLLSIVVVIVQEPVITELVCAYAR